MLIMGPEMEDFICLSVYNLVANVLILSSVSVESASSVSQPRLTLSVTEGIGFIGVLLLCVSDMWKEELLAEV